MRKNLFTIFVMAILANSAMGQLAIQNSASGFDFNYTQPSGYYQPCSSCGISNGEPVPRSCIFLEYGDGGFTTNFSTTYRPVTSGTLFATSTLRGKYDDGHPVARIISQQYTSNVTSPGTPQTDLAGSGKNIMIRSDVSDLLENDRIQVVLTFKKTFDGTGKILFYYNDALNGFDPISGTLLDYNNNAFQQIRVYNSSVSYCTSVQAPYQLTIGSCPNPITPSGLLYHVNDVETPNYSNVAVFTLAKTLTSRDEQNIFITLRTNNACKFPAKIFSALRAYIISDLTPYNNVQTDDSSPYFSELSFSTIPYDVNEPLKPRPHDPNYILPKVRCLSASPCLNITPMRFQPKFETIDYKVHFQNDGIGLADSITVYVYFPSGNFDPTFPASMNIRARVGRKQVNGMNLEYSIHPTYIKFVLRNHPLSYDPSNPAVKLLGGASLSMGNADPTTMGEITFSVRTKKSLPCYRAFAKIYFNKEAPIITKTSSLRYCELPIGFKCGQYLPCDYKEVKDVKLKADKALRKE